MVVVDTRSVDDWAVGRWKRGCLLEGRWGEETEGRKGLISLTRTRPVTQLVHLLRLRAPARDAPPVPDAPRDAALPRHGSVSHSGRGVDVTGGMDGWMGMFGTVSQSGRGVDVTGGMDGWMDGCLARCQSGCGVAVRGGGWMGVLFV